MTGRSIQRLGGIILGAFLALTLSPRESRGETPPGPAERPTVAVDPGNCVTAECHSDIKGYQMIHGPVVADDCDACHVLTSAEDHTFDLWRQEKELCTYCHEFDTGLLPVVHEPVVLNECLGCHNPHGGTDRSLTRETTMARTCGRCHESVTRDLNSLHNPVGSGECNTCHRPHASKYPNLLDALGTDLCLTCHDEFADQMEKAEFTHPALDDGCTRCHGVHGAPYATDLTQPIPEMCLECHEEIGDTAATATYKHPPVLEDCACLTCHTAHGGNLNFLMCDSPVQICMDCHEKDTVPDGVELITAMLRINDPARFKHTPVREGQCGGCHTVHGGDVPLLLNDTYPTQFHQSFSIDNYDLCFDCHDTRLVEKEQAEGLTDFRNGDRNLHFVHVAADDVFGRNCRVCHGVHTSKYPALVRDKVPYGGWQMVMRFDKLETGGTCMTGCHPQLSYDRVNPVTTNTVLLASRPSPHVPVADKWEPVVVEWSTRDIHGTEVHVPASDRPSVLLFLRANQPQCRKVVKMAIAASPQIDGAQVIVVFSGKDAEEQATSFAATGMVPWPVVADPGYSISMPSGVEVRPATLVVQSDGVVLTHMGGAPPSLTLQLAGYLDLAAGTISRDDLAQRLKENGLVGDGPAKRANRFLLMGRNLLDQDKAEEAQAMFADGLALQPDSIDLQVEMIRALVELKQGEEAMKYLGRLPAGAAPSWERDLLRGRVLAILGQWDEARRLATEVLSQNPDLGEAHFLMGMVHENAREWEKAVEEYRAAYSRGVR